MVLAILGRGIGFEDGLVRELHARSLCPGLHVVENAGLEVDQSSHDIEGQDFAVGQRHDMESPF